MVGTKLRLGIREGRLVVGYVRQLRLLALLLVNHLRDFFFVTVCDFDVDVDVG